LSRVASIDSHGRAPSSLTGPLYRGAGCYSLSGLPDHGCRNNPGLSIRSSTGGPGPVSLALHAGAVTHPREVPYSTPQRAARARHSDTPARPFRPVFSAPKFPKKGAEKPHPLPSLADGVVISEPFWERPAGTQTHSRRTGRKLGQLRCARQELVRVPESNTKYGGNVGKTGGIAPS
jgi:hypothetical protein